MRWAALVVASAFGILLLAEEVFSPARFLAGNVPVVPVTTVGGGQVIVELTVSEEGRVTAVTPLRTTPPFTDLVVEAVRNWQFRPAEQDVATDRDRVGASRQMMPIASRVLIAAIFRPPALTGPTLGEIPTDLRRASDDVALPMTMTMPPLPPMASKSGVVLLEVDVDRDGAVAAIAVIHSAPSFDDVAQAAVKTWKFRPARVRNISVPTVVYVLFGFRVPVSIPAAARDRGREGLSSISERRLKRDYCITIAIRSWLDRVGHHRRRVARGPRGDRSSTCALTEPADLPRSQRASGHR